MGKLFVWLFAAGKMGKLLITTGTMLISIVVYSFVFGWPYAVGFVLLIFVHEMGHYIAARQKGLDVGVPTFIPFVGAWIQMKEMPTSVETEAYVGFAGPIAGTVGALACYWYAREQGSQLFLALSYAGFMINLFNLIPISPLDGGRITAIISPKVWFLGIPLLIALFIYHPSPMLILIAVLAYPQLKHAWALHKGTSTQDEHYYDVPLNKRVNYAALYLGLVLYLAFMTYDVHEMLSGVG